MDDKLDPRQIEFLKGYNDPKSKTFGNALQSAVKAGYSQEYAENITSLMPDWLSESIGRRKRLLEKAEKNLENLLDSEDEKIQADMSKFVTKTLGKNEGYSERVEQDITSAGKPIPLLHVLDNRSSQEDSKTQEEN